MRSGTHFEVELQHLNGARESTLRSMPTEVEVLAFAKKNLQPHTCLLVACIGKGVDYGNLIIEVGADGNSDVRALEHRGFLLKGVSLEMALNVLDYWLPLQERRTDCQWNEE